MCPAIYDYATTVTLKAKVRKTTVVVGVNIQLHLIKLNILQTVVIFQKCFYICYTSSNTFSETRINKS